MADVRIVLNSAGIRALLKSSGIAGVCEAQAEKMTKATGIEYIPDVYVGRTRVNAAARTREIGKGSVSTKKKGSWVTVNGQKRFVKGYKRKKVKA